MNVVMFKCGENFRFPPSRSCRWFGSVFASVLVLNSAKVGRGLDDLGVSVVVTVSMFGWHLVLEY